MLSPYELTIESDPVSEESTNEGVPIVDAPSTRQVRGSLSYLSANEAYRARHFGEEIVAVAGLPARDPIDHRDRIVLDPERNNTCLDPRLYGSWTVAAVVPGPKRVRVLLRRSEDP